MARCFLRILIVAVLCAPLALHAQTTCSGTRLLTVGGPIRLDAGGFLPQPLVATVTSTMIDVSHPALTRYATPSVIFEYVFPDARPVQIYFAAVRADGQTYRITDQEPTYQIAASAGTTPGQVEVRQIVFDHPLVFDAGDLLATVVRPASNTSSGLVFYTSSAPQGVLFGNWDLAQAGSAPLSALGSIRSAAAAVSMQGSIECAAIPAPELFIPVVGDTQGLAHYWTEVTLFAGNPFVSPTGVNWTVRDRKENPNAATLINGTATANPTGTLAGLPADYLGSMTISFPGYNGQYKTNDTARLSDDAIATARITARIPLGETGSSINGVSCERIGHTIAVPFHVTENHRVNVGVASAQLNSCGIYRPATTVVVRVNNGTDVIIAMPAESSQLDNITGANSVLPEAVGLTDGVVYFTVTDEASRIVAYSSLLDNTSQSATLTYGTVVR